MDKFFQKCIFIEKKSTKICKYQFFFVSLYDILQSCCEDLILKNVKL